LFGAFLIFDVGILLISSQFLIGYKKIEMNLDFSDKTIVNNVRINFIYDIFDPSKLFTPTSPDVHIITEINTESIQPNSSAEFKINKIIDNVGVYVITSYCRNAITYDKSYSENETYVIIYFHNISEKCEFYISGKINNLAPSGYIKLNTDVRPYPPKKLEIRVGYTPTYYTCQDYCFSGLFDEYNESHIVHGAWKYLIVSAIDKKKVGMGIGLQRSQIYGFSMTLLLIVGALLLEAGFLHRFNH